MIVDLISNKIKKIYCFLFICCDIILLEMFLQLFPKSIKYYLIDLWVNSRLNNEILIIWG